MKESFLMASTMAKELINHSLRKSTSVILKMAKDTAQEQSLTQTDLNS